MASIVLSKKNFDHPWIYRSLIREITGTPVDGSVVDVLSSSKQFLAKAYFNSKSEITVRALTRENRPIDASFFSEKIKKAVEYRKRFVTDTNAYRLISSEADDLPGVIVDFYADILVLQILTLGMEKMRPLILAALEAHVSVKGIYEKSDSNSRSLEGLEPRVGWIRQDCGADVEVYEGKIRYSVPLGGGHKTGFYLDQRENRLGLAASPIRGKVLDAFCYTGGFGLHLAAKGCQVLGIDQSEEALKQAEANRELNGISKDRLQFKCANVFDELKNFDKAKEKFDCVILDPPSFVKRKKELDGALSGYKEIILRSLKILNPESYLSVFSCSYHVGDDLLMQVVLNAAFDTRREIKLIKFLKQSVDHPINPFIPESYYLKGFLFFVQ